METQQLLDALTDHLAIYHRNSGPRTESRERQKVIEWLVGLNHEQRQAALTVVDGPWVAILLSMQKYLVAEGRGSFFLLPDVPGSVGETLGVELRSSKHNDGKVEKNTSDSKSRRHLKLHRALGSKGSDRVDKGCTRCSSTLPGLCFRRARGLVGRLHKEEEAGDMLVNNIRLFSSEDGEAKIGLGKADAGRMLDCISITDDLLNNLDTFFGVMDDLSHHEFLRSPCHVPASPWEEMPWLKDMGYYGLEAFIANKFEFALWSAWRCAQGTKRPPRLLALKLRDAQAGRSVRSCSCDLRSNAGVASSIIRKKLGCINWWCRLARKERAQMIKCTLAMACKSEVMKLVGDAKASSSKLGDVNYKGKNKLLCMDTGETRLKSTLKASLSDSEVDQQVTLAGKSGNGATVVPFLIGLQALKELSESGLLCGKSEGISPVQETDASWLFDSTLKSAHTLSDRVLRKVRNVLVKVRNDRVEIELLGDENSGNLHSSNGGENSQVKSTKSKKKRRKQSSAHKVEVVHQDEKLPSSKLKSVKGQEEAEENLEIESGTVEKWSSGPQQLVGGSSTQQSSSRIGKGGKLKSKKVERLHQNSKLQLKTTDMNGKEDSTASDVSMQGIYGRSTNGNDGGRDVKVEHLDEGCNLGLEKSAVDQYQGLPTSNMENGNGSHRKSSNRKGRGCKSKSRLEEVPNASVVHMTESVLGENERPYASTFELNVGSNVRDNGQGDARKAKLNKGEKLRNGFTVRSSEVVVDVKDELLSSHVEKNGGSIYLKTGKAVGTDCVENVVSLMASTGENHEQSRGRPEYEDIAIFHKSEESYTSRSASQGVLPNSVSGTCDTCLIEDVGMLNRVELNPQKISSGLSEEKPCQNGCVDSTRILGEQKGNSESAVICFGTFDTVLPAPVRIPDPSHLSKTPVKVETPTGCSTQKGKESWDQVQGSARAQVMDLGNWSEGASHSRYIRSGPKGSHPPTKTSRQLEFPSNGLSHYQQGTVVRSGPHEWPGSVQVGFSGVCNQPTASDWLQLDVGRSLPPRMQSSLLTYRSTPVSMPRGRQADTSSVTATTRPMIAVNQEWPSFVQYLKGPPALALPVPPREESRLTGRPPLQPSQLPPGSWEVEANGGPALDLFEIEDKFAYDTDVDDYGVYKAGDFDDFDGYLVSEEEGERSLEDVSDSTAADYNQIFGGGVMYWNAADYAGMGYSRPGSLSSEDSSWARHEADLSVVLDDIVNYPLVQSGYSGKGPAVSNVTSSSPPSSSSLPVSFEHVSPVATSNSRHGVPRHVGNEFPGKFSMHSNPAISSEEPTGVSRVSSSSEVIEKIRVDNLGQPILRPIVVVRDITLSRQVSSGEALRLQEAKSPHIVPRSKRDFPGHRKRPPSPVLRCVPPAPPPPPPSPVAGPRRRKGFVAARSGSSSPRHWGLVNWPYKDETDNTEGKAKGGSPEGLIAGGRRRVGVANNPPMHPLSGTLLRERLIAVPPLALEQEHPDSGLPMKTTLIQSTSPALHHALTKLLKVIHMEIDAFCFQVAKENKRRRPFVNTAVKKVAHSLQVLWPRSRTKIFGSIATGLALPTSDVDLVVCLPPVRNLEPIKEAGILEGRNGIKETCLQHAARYLADQDWVKIDSLKTIENTLVPIIILVAEFPPHQCEMEDEKGPFFLGSKLRKYSVDEGGPKVDTISIVDLETIDSCKKDINASGEEEKGPWGGKADRQLVRLDISFEAPSHTGLRTAELVRELIGQFPALSPLALVLKQFLTDRSLDHPYTGGLSSYCLVLLITRFLQHQSHLTNLIHNGRQSANQNLGSLFVDFLHFFGCVFDPRRMGVRIRGGGMYLNRDRFHGIDPLYIEDPLHPDNNVGRNCFRILQCVKAFADAYAVFEKKLHVVSNCSVDVVNEAANLELLQTILPGLANA